ncbi:MAG TPA: adenylate/guanylate cyclase domain-containing protein [Actinomycetota bacterium]|nr:adenylate/guanylate cyclase domain-containing protein [Actinomycetota bacterium]
MTSDEPPDGTEAAEPHHETLARIRENLLGGSLRYTREEVAADAGVPLEQVRVLWRSMGYPDVGEAVAFTREDVAALHRMLHLIKVGGIDPETANDLVRALGQTTARLADWQVNTLAGLMERSGTIDRADGLATRTLDAFGDELDRMMPDLQALLVYVWRRALAHAVTRAAAVGGASPDESETGLLSVGFADMVGFTRLSRRLPEDELARLVHRFEAASSDIVAAAGGRLVKTVGDEVLFTTNSADQAAEIALRLHETHADDDSVPEVRVGLATGQVLSRMGDVFGTTVNLASRLTAMARPGGTLVDADTKAQLDQDERFVLRAQRGRPVRGFGVMRAFTLNRSSTRSD